MRDPARRRELLQRARLYLLFTPSLCAGDPLETLAAALPWVDAVQVRTKGPGVGEGVTEARAALDWTERVLERVGERDVLVLVNDRPDVARTLLGRGCDGVHLGQDDAPPRLARDLLGPEALVGLSTHDAPQVVLGSEEPVDYLGFGPVFATPTKGYDRGLGPEAVWVASEATALPVFPIGGIATSNVDQLDRAGRAAVSSAILADDDPGEAARTLKELLLAGGDPAT